MPLPIADAVVQQVADYGTQEGMTSIRFLTGKKKLLWDSSLIAGVDYIPADSPVDGEEDDEDCSYSEEEDEELSYDSEEDSDDDSSTSDTNSESSEDTYFFEMRPTSSNQATAAPAPTQPENDIEVTGVEAEAPEDDASLGAHAIALDDVLDGDDNAEAIALDEVADGEEEIVFEDLPQGIIDEEQEEVESRYPTRDRSAVDKIVSYESFYCKEMAPFWAQHAHNCIQLAYGQQAQASFAQTYNLKQGLKVFGEEGEASAMKEIGQIHGRGSLSPVYLRDLTDEEAKKAFDLVTVMLRKQNGIVKTRMCLNGSTQKNWDVQRGHSKSHCCT